MTRGLWTGVALCFASIALGFAATAGLTAIIDKHVMSVLAFGSRDPRWLVSIVRAVTMAGDPEVRAIYIAMFGAIIAWKRSGPAAIAYLITVGLSIMGYSVMKEAFERARPALSPWFDDPTNAAYPSGHAAGAVVVLVLGMMLSGAGRGWIALAIVIAFAIGTSRVLLGVHWPSDVLGGWLWGGGCALIGYALARAKKKKGLF